MTDFGRKPEETEPWGNAIALAADALDSLQMNFRTLHKDAVEALPPGTRYEFRLQAGRGICWYRCAEMDGTNDWGCHTGPRGDYELMGQFITPG